MALSATYLVVRERSCLEPLMSIRAAPPGAAPKKSWTRRQIVVLLVIGVGALMVSLTQSLLVPVLSG